MSVGESGGGNKDDVNLDAMTEDEQIAYAMRMSMQDEAGPSASGGAEKMEVDEQAADKEDYSEAMNDPAFLQVSKIFRQIAVRIVFWRFFSTISQSVLESLPGVDPQSDAVRQAVGAMSRGSDNTKKEDSEKKDDKSKK